MGYFLSLNYRKKSELYDVSDELSVVLRYYFEKQRLNITTEVTCKIKDWNQDWEKTNKKEPIKKTDVDSVYKNFLLKQKIKELDDIIFQIQKDGGIPNTDLVKSQLRSVEVKKIKKSLEDIHFQILFENYKSWINSDVYTNRISYVRSLNSSIKDVINYTEEYQLKEKCKLLLTDITVDWVEGLIRWCDKKGLQSSTIKKRMKVLVNFSTWLQTSHQIYFKVPKPRKSLKEPIRDVIFLTRDEVMSIYKFDEFNIDNPSHSKYITEKGSDVKYIEDKVNNKEGKIVYTSFEVYKDMLLFLCGVGCRFGDVVKMRVDNFEFDENDRTKGEFSYQSEKTNKIVRVPVNLLTFNIWKKYSKNKTRVDYLFPRTDFGNPISNQKFNKHIKVISEIIKLNRGVKFPKFNLDSTVVEGTQVSVPLYQVISSHIGRRTFIREQIQSGKPIRTIMSLSGHNSQKVFDRYYDVLKEDRMENNDKVFNFNLIDSPIKENEKVVNENIKEELVKLKNLLDDGLLPLEIYMGKVNQLMGL